MEMTKMPELIDRQAVRLLESDADAYTENWNDDYEKGFCDAINKVLELPTIESEPVRNGRWINDTFCSECKRFPVDVSVSISNQELTKYFSRCPHCGAHMREGCADNG